MNNKCRTWSNYSIAIHSQREHASLDAGTCRAKHNSQQASGEQRSSLESCTWRAEEILAGHLQRVRSSLESCTWRAEETLAAGSLRADCTCVVSGGLTLQQLLRDAWLFPFEVRLELLQLHFEPTDLSVHDIPSRRNRSEGQVVATQNE